MNGYKNYDDEDFNIGNPNNQGYTPDEYDSQTYDNANYYETDTPSAGQIYNDQTYTDQTYNGQMYGDQTYNNPSYGGQIYGEQTYNDSSYNGQMYGEQTYNGQSYGGQMYDDQTYNNPSYSGQVYGEQTYSEQPFMNVTYGNSNYESENYSDYTSNNADYTTLSDDNPDFIDITYTESGTAPGSTQESIRQSLYSDDYKETAHAFDNQSSDDYEEDALTEAEIADIKRQKAAERRKKLAARERRRKKRMQKVIIRWIILILGVILVIFGLVKLVTGIKNHFEKEKQARELSEFLATSEATTEEPVADIDESIIAKELPTDRDAALLILAEQAENDTDIQGIYDNAAALPDSVLKHLAANSELKNFAIMYPAKINIVFDGDFTVELENRNVPLYLQYDERWGYADYSNDLIALSGSGPTALSMACTYLKQDGSMNPVKIADYATEHGYLDADGNTDWSLMTDGVASLGLVTDEMDVDKEDMIDTLEDGRLLICKMSSGDFTTTEHYILITDYKDGFFYVHDPASKGRSEVGWDYKRLSKQINKMCSAEAGTEDVSGSAPVGDASGDAVSGDAADNN